MTMKIDGIDVCEPISELVQDLLNIGLNIIDEKVSDYHFHEVCIKMVGSGLLNLNGINIENIKKVNQDTFACECHWSVVKVSYIAPNN